MTTFDALSARRSAYVVAARENGFEEGLRRLLADLYPDNAHFIYELLQNAEDAGARQVVFELRGDGLLVEHDGARLFDLRDIESITSIGQSTKADDATSIGKFGVGFKAVFAYTQTPVIHSGTHSFAIRDLFVPVVVPGGGRPGWTTFWFPFDRPDKPADRAAAEVAHALRELSGTTLLFLNNITSIASSVFGDEPLRLDRRAIDGNVIEIASSHDMAGPARWYRIAGDVEVDGRPFPVAAAFALEAPPAKPDTAEMPKTRSKGYAVVPVDGRVSIYFPAVKETSGLRFHLHAPFASTVARDSVRDDPGNDALVDGIGTLVAQALPAMRDAGLLTDGLLSALPNADDDLPARYEVLRERIIEAFDNEPLTPVAGGGHAPGKRLLRSDRSLREALTVKDVRFLLSLAALDDDEAIEGWMLAREGRARAFLDSLDAVDFGPYELSQALSRAARGYENAARYGFNRRNVPWHLVKPYETWHDWTKWIETKPDKRLRTLYIALGTLAAKLKASHPYNLTLAKAPLLRVRDGATTRHVPGKEAYLPTAPGLHVDGLVPHSLLVPDDDGDEATKDMTKVARRALRDFYDHAEVQPWDAAAQLRARFAAYDLHPASVTARHVEDLRQLKRLLDDNVVEATTFEGLAFLVAVRRDGERHWAPPRDVYLDQPFLATGLAALYQSHQYRGTPPGQLDPAYASENFDIAGLADTLDVTRGLSVRPADISDNPKFQKSWSRGKQRAYTRVAQDWQIPNFDLIVATEDEDLLRSLWRTVVFAKASFAEAEFQANMTSPRYALESQLLQSLRHTPWVLDSDGNLRLPTDITADELAEGLVVPDASPMLQHVGFGRNAAIAVAERRERELQAKALGFESVDVLLEIAEAYQADPESVRAWLRERKNLTLPEGASADPEQRARGAGENAADAPERRSEKRVRTVQIQVPGLQSAARAYLTQMYTNDEGVMVCQVCTSAMPFKVGGDYYFEAVQFVKDSTRDLHENRLALCPTCAAMYRHARDTPLEDLRAALLAHPVGGQSSITIGLMLAGEAAMIRFVGKHAIDLQAALAATKGVQSEDDEPEGPLLSAPPEN
ncbi:sacsin N-terminal ATP-binding-like domain-containing protein [Micromonospora tulbaghiae]